MAPFMAHRRQAELVTPARPTPHEYKALSDIDDQLELRYYTAGVEFFRRCDAAGDDAAAGDDPVMIIRAALAEALVSFYPLAGRLRELPGGGGKLLVECTAEGVVFVQADADVRLEELSQPLALPEPFVKEFMCCDQVGQRDVVVGKPLIFIQVTRFRNNEGFAIGYHFCHSITDAFGVAQLLDAVYRLVRGEQITNPPVWERELLSARAPPRVTHEHPAYEPLPVAAAAAEDVLLTMPLEAMAPIRSFRLGPTEMAALRRQVPAGLLQSATMFVLVTAALWRCRTAALGYGPSQRVRVLVVSSARWNWKRDTPLPRGFYGNTFIPLIAEATAGELCGRPLAHAVELVQKAKFSVTDEYMQSFVDMLVQRGRPSIPLDWTYAVADTGGLGRMMGATKLAGGWERAGGGITAAGRKITASRYSYYERCKGATGVESAVVTMCLPAAAMERFAREISGWSNSGSSTMTSSL
ncbi:hypothetical protein GUJ93_ZPchr0010g11246 [Zizania palustris]|uniref:Uncharacterized protein n=1 Tax=Zizania palustris TaxID=103762 RepID=A0A8J6BIW9_ZIZPA|nr:hypothetical protein GUJ93_ZPchr0010g11246 [Zizania palustris]